MEELIFLLIEDDLEFAADFSLSISVETFVDFVEPLICNVDTDF